MILWNYLKYLPKTAKIEDNYTVDAKTAGRLDKMANALYNISLNKAIFNLFNYFNVLAFSKENIFGLLRKALCNRQKTAEYKPTKEFLDNLSLLSSEYSKARATIALKEKTHSYLISNFVLKRMGVFLFLSQNFGYQIPQNLKTDFMSKINSLINTMKSVFSSYSMLESEQSLEDRLIAIKIDRIPYNIAIDNIADYICSTPVSNYSKYVSCIFSAEFLLDLIANATTMISYKDKNSDFTDENSHQDYVYDFCSRLQLLMQDSAKFALFTNNAKKDKYFPLCKISREEDTHYYHYSLYGYYKIPAEDGLCYLNLAELFNQLINLSCPYEFTRQALMAKLPEIMPVISTVFCDIPKIC